MASSFRVYRALVFPAGTGISLEIWSALRSLKEVVLIGATSKSTVPDHGELVYSSYYNDLPPLSDAEGLVASISRIVADEKIDVIFPAYDDAVNFFAEHRPVWGENVKVMAPSFEACEIVRSKKLTYEALSGCIKVPRLFSAEDAASLPYPVFVKPERGEGSRGAQVCNDSAQLATLLTPGSAAYVRDAIICELLPGAEYTVDCFSDRERGLLFCAARTRARVRAGLSMATEPIELAGIEHVAEAVCRRLGLYGTWFFQIKHAANGELTLLEVGPRVAGAMALHRHFGVNFPLLSIFEAFRLPVSICSNMSKYGITRMDKGYVNRFVSSLEYARVYVDLDDTLIMNNSFVNTELVQFLYQCLNKGIERVLLTRTAHRHPLSALRRFSLTEIFNRIIHLKAGEKKSAHVHAAPGGAIFIDDSFAERADVGGVCGIPVFDTSMLELLLDSRTPVNCAPRLPEHDTDRSLVQVRRYEDERSHHHHQHDATLSRSPSNLDGELLVHQRVFIQEFIAHATLAYASKPGRLLQLKPAHADTLWQPLALDGFTVSVLTPFDESMNGSGVVSQIKALGDSCFDYIVCVGALQHTERPFAVVSELARCLDKGGYLFANVPCNLCMSTSTADHWRCTPSGLRCLLESSGLTVCDLQVLELPDRAFFPVDCAVVALKS